MWLGMYYVCNKMNAVHTKIMNGLDVPKGSSLSHITYYGKTAAT